VEHRQTLHWAWVILGVCFVNLFINYSVRLGYGVVLPEMIRTFGFGRAAGGTIYNSYLFVYIAITPFAGYLTDRLGARCVITTCLLILGIGVVLMGTMQSLWNACLFFAVTGLGASGIWTPILTLVQRWFARHRRGFAMGLVSTGYGLGFATMGAVFPWIVAHFNWRYAWFFLGGMAFLMALVNGILLRRDPANSGLQPWGHKETLRKQISSTNTAKKRIPLTIPFRDSRFWVIGCSYFTITYSCYGITTFMVDYAKYQLDMPLEKATLLATIHGVGQIVGVLTVLPLSDFLGRKKTIIISNAFITASLLGILMAGNMWEMLYIFMGCFGIFYGVTFPIYGLCAGDYFSRETIGTIIGAWTPFYGGGAIAAHWITGILRDATGTYYQSFIIFIFAAAVSILLMSLVRKQ
jgi:sugar phosphate permease